MMVPMMMAMFMAMVVNMVLQRGRRQLASDSSSHFSFNPSSITKLNEVIRHQDQLKYSQLLAFDGDGDDGDDARRHAFHALRAEKLMKMIHDQ